MSHAAPRRLTLLAAFAAIYLFWGATFLAVRYAVLVVPPLLIIVFRCAGGALILFAWLAWRRELERTTWAQWRTAAIAGLFLFLGSHVSLAWAEQRMSSGQAALFTSAIPLWIVLMESAKARAIPLPTQFASGRVGTNATMKAKNPAPLSSTSSSGVLPW